jgi:hypothetical protein
VFNLIDAFDYIEELTKSSPTVSVGMSQLLDYCELKTPNHLWSVVRGLDFERDTKKLRVWLEHVLLSEPPSDDIKGFWFGLFNPVKDGEVSCALYISGSITYSDEPGWAVWNDTSYLPKDKYADSIVLHEIYRILEKNNMFGDEEYVLCLGYACLAINAIYESAGLKRLDRPVAVGFDSGDYIILG